MKQKTAVLASIWGLFGLMFAADAPPCIAQIDIHIHTVTGPMESHIGSLTGNSSDGKTLYRRFCIGCHGPNGDGTGENAMWFDPTMGFEKPRDFTLAVFKCRSTPTGTLPTDEDLSDAVTRGFVTTNMPQWRPLIDQDRANLVAFIKTFSARWQTDKPGTPITVPAETPATIESILHGRELFQKMECWKCHGPEGRGDGPSAATLTDSKNNPIRPYDFATGERFKCGESNRDLYRIFMTGLDGTPMPSFADVIKPEEGWDLVHFLRTLQISLKTPEQATFEKWRSSHPGQLKPIGPEQAPGI